MNALHGHTRRMYPDSKLFGETPTRHAGVPRVMRLQFRLRCDVTLLLELTETAADPWLEGAEVLP